MTPSTSSNCTIRNRFVIRTNGEAIWEWARNSAYSVGYGRPTRSKV